MGSPLDESLSEALVLLLGDNPFASAAYFPDAVVQKYGEGMLAHAFAAKLEYANLNYEALKEVGFGQEPAAYVRAKARAAEQFSERYPSINSRGLRVLRDNFDYEN